MTGNYLNWSPSALGADFLATLVQRWHEDLIGWCTIARCLREATHAFTDIEARLGVPELYRVLPVDVHGGLGVPDVAVANTIPVTGAECFNYRLTSNADPTIDEEAVTGEEVTFALPSSVTVVQNEGRNRQRLFRSADQLGDVVTKLAIDRSSSDCDAGSGPELWRPLRAKLEADLDYICVLDLDGNRWFAGFEILDAPTRFAGSSDLDVAFVEVQDYPSPVLVP